MSASLSCFIDSHTLSSFAFLSFSFILSDLFFSLIQALCSSSASFRSLVLLLITASMAPGAVAAATMSEAKSGARNEAKSGARNEVTSGRLLV